MEWFSPVWNEELAGPAQLGLPGERNVKKKNPHHRSGPSSKAIYFSAGHDFVSEFKVRIKQ